MISDLYAKCMISFLRNGEPIFQSSCTVLHSHQQILSVFIALCPHQHLMLSVFQILAILIGM